MRTMNFSLKKPVRDAVFNFSDKLFGYLHSNVQFRMSKAMKVHTLYATFNTISIKTFITLALHKDFVRASHRNVKSGQ